MGRITKYNQFAEDPIQKLNDLKKSWQEFEDQHPWEFDYFYEKIAAYYQDYQNMYRGGNRDVDYEIDLEGYENVPTLPTAKDDKDWRKRNGRISAKVCTGGYSGGSCWDDENSYARPYDTGVSLDYEDFQNFIEHILVSIFGRNHAFADIPKLLENLRSSNIIIEDNYTNYEYYGNHDDYQVYYVKLWDLYQFLAKQGAF